MLHCGLVLVVLFFFPLTFFSLCILGWEVSIYSSLSSLILSLAVLNPLMSPSKAFFISVPVLFIYSISFWFFLRIFISLLTLPICSCILSISSTRALNILIVVVLNFLPDNFNICVISHTWVWFWCLLYLFSLCFFLPLGMPKVSNASSILAGVSFLYVCVSLSTIPQSESV